MPLPTLDVLPAWHFVGDTLRDGRPVPPDGVWLEHDGPIELCQAGLHASLDPYDALQYAPGPVLCRVDLSGRIVHGHDKVVASRRRIVQRVDLTDILRLFARQCALDVIHLWEAPDVVRRYLETGDEAIRDAAKDAAWAAWAAWAAAGDAAWAAAKDAAWAAAKDAAWAAKDAAWAAWAAGAAAGAAARAAGAAQRQRFNVLVSTAIQDGAR